MAAVVSRLYKLQPPLGRVSTSALRLDAQDKLLLAVLPLVQLLRMQSARALRVYCATLQ